MFLLSRGLCQVRIHTTAAEFNLGILLEHSRDVEFAVSARRDRSLDRGRPQYIPARTTRIGHRAPTPMKWRDPKIVGSNPTGPATAREHLYSPFSSETGHVT